MFALLFLILGGSSLIKGDAGNYTYLLMSGVFFIISFLFPKWLYPFNYCWTLFGCLLNKVMSPVVLLVIFFGVVTPISFLLRLLKIDILHLKWNSGTPSYWLPRSPRGPDRDSLKNQF